MAHNNLYGIRRVVGLVQVSFTTTCHSYRILERLVPFKCEGLLYFHYNLLTPGTLLDKHRCMPSQHCPSKTTVPKSLLKFGVEEEA